MIAIGICWYLGALYCIHNFLGIGQEHYACGWEVGGSVSDIIKYLILRPGEAFQYMFKVEKLALFTEIFSLLLFLPFLSLELYIAIPIFLQVLLFKSPIRLESYYLCGMIPFIFIGLIFVLRNMDRFLKKRIGSKVDIVNLLLGILLLLCLFAVGGKNIYGSLHTDRIYDKQFVDARNIYDRRFYVQDDLDKTAWKIIKMIPKDAVVSATGDLLMPLSHRKEVYEFAFDDIDDGGGYDYFDVDYIAVNNTNQYHGAGHYAFPEERHMHKLNGLIRNGTFDVLYEKKGFLLLKRSKSVDQQ